MGDNISQDLKSGAMFYHQYPRPGKLEIQPTKPLGNQRDLALAYSPGVAAPCEAIAADPAQAANLTSRQNLVAVISNGTAVLGLGDIGPLASKPVMEGKAVLFKKFSGIDVFDIEVAENNVDKLVEVIAALEPTFGGINLEDIKAPECFEVEERLKARMGIPVFHDDQHGTAIIVGAAVTNALELAGKRIEDVKIVTSGAGAAALACLNLLVSLGAKRENIWVTDIKGVVHEGRNELMDRWKSVYAQDTDARTLADVIAECRRVPRPLGRRRSETRAARPDGAAPADHGARQSLSGDHAGRGRGRAARRDDLHRPLGLSEPGQQRPVLSLHLPRRARCRRDHDQRGDEGRRREGHRRSCARSALRGGGARLWRRGASLRREVPDPEPVRSAPDPAHRAGGGEGRDGFRRRHEAARGSRGLRGIASAASCSAPASS